MTGEQRHAVLATTVVVAAGIVAGALRFLTLEGFPNDHFVHLTAAAQMLMGDWPTRDFADPGLPLMYATSALGQALLGPSLFSEAVLVAAAFAVAAALTATAVLQLTSSVVLAAMAAALEIAIFPRTYGYPKLILYAAGFTAFGWYLRRPTRPRLLTMAMVAVIAFLFRHDHGLYLGAGAVLTAFLGAEARLAGRVRRAALCAAAIVAGLLPYLAYVQLHGGLGLYFRTGIEFSAQEAQRQGRVWPGPFGAEPSQVALLYLFHALPLAALAVLVKNRRAAAAIVPLAAVAVLVNFSFIRDPLNTRLPDAIVPAVLLGAWLMASAWRAPRLRTIWIPVSLAVLLVAASSVVVVGNTREEIDRIGLSGRWLELPARFGQRTAELRDRFSPRQMPTRAVDVLRPFFAYVDRCTEAEDRLLVGGFLPEVPYYARRGFAGGQSTFLAGYFGSATNQQLVVQRLGNQRVPFVLMPSDEAGEFDRGFPLVAEYLRGRYEAMTSVALDEETAIAIQVDRRLAGAPRDPASGWPCVRQAASR